MKEAGLISPLLGCCCWPSIALTVYCNCIKSLVVHVLGAAGTVAFIVVWNICCLIIALTPIITPRGGENSVVI